MNTKKLYIIRHGQTDYNERGVVQGSGIDSSLNEKGRNQANAFYQAYKDIKFDKIYTSELQRTHQSVRQFLENDFPHQILSGLNEINWGVKEGEEVSNDPNSYYMQVAQAWRNGELDKAIEGGESPIQVQERQKIALEKILQNINEKTVLICMHGRAMRIFLSLLLKTDLTKMDQYSHSNLCLYRLNYLSERFELEIGNDIVHLS